MTALKAEHDALVAHGIKGELTTAALDTFLVSYFAVKCTLDTGLQQSDPTESQMITTMALSDPEIGRDYYSLSLTMPPVDLKTAVTILESVLKGKERHAQIVQARHGALLVAKETPPPAPAPPNALEVQLAALTALVTSRLSDPRFTGAGRPPSGPANAVKAPRNADGSVKEWVEGMALCRGCKGKHPADGGKHLNRNCPEWTSAGKGKGESGSKDSGKYFSSPTRPNSGASPGLAFANCRCDGSTTC